MRFPPVLYCQAILSVFAPSGDDPPVLLQPSAGSPLEPDLLRGQRPRDILTLVLLCCRLEGLCGEQQGRGKWHLHEVTHNMLCQGVGNTQGFTRPPRRNGGNGWLVRHIKITSCVNLSPGLSLKPELAL